jgi:CYTH domain-containing protein
VAKEIERKFLVSGEAWRDGAGAAVGIRQFYLAATPERSIRVRIRDGASAMLTLKFGIHARERDEFEYAIPIGEAEEMSSFAIGHVIEKTRHHILYGDRLYEIDVFTGSLAGLVIAELETPDRVADSELPPWVGREVTGDPGYYNASLALHGLPAGT